MRTQYTWKYNVSAAIGAKIFRRVLFHLRSNMRNQYTQKWNISAAVGAKRFRKILDCPQYNISCRKVVYSHVLSAHIIPNTKWYSPESFGTNNCQNIAAPTAAEIFRFYVYWLRILLRRQNNILRNISAPTAAETLYFHVYWVRILFQMQSDILQNLLAPTATEIFQFHVY